MYRGTTPTYTLTFPEDIDFTNVNVYVSLSRTNKSEIFRKTNADLDIQGNVINVFLTQAETLALPQQMLIQVNWTYVEEGVTKRACSDIVTVTNKDNLINEVL